VTELENVNPHYSDKKLLSPS